MENTNKKLVSVVVPIYNREKTVEKCIKSILNQTYKNIELVLIDDGSTDDTFSVCKSYAEKDDRIKLFQKDNGGVSSARNYGIEKATGDLLMFVDSDDTIEENTVKDYVRSLDKYDADFVSSETLILLLLKKSIKKKGKLFLRYLSSISSYSPWGKMYKLSVIKENDIRFDTSMKACEDAPFVREYLTFCDKLCFVKDKYYKWNNTEQSLSKKGYEDYCLYFAKKLDVLNNLLKSAGYSESTVNKFISYRAVHGIYISIAHYKTFYRENFSYYADKAINCLSGYISTDKELHEYKKWYKAFCTCYKKPEDLLKIQVSTLIKIKRRIQKYL